ncbi:MAG: hypothetical protein EU548_07670 [Promethearchaeota archaeon]|nr:MAG: hypothetical protein EU548_07670 [Candidatus Lokiarchaeota archaeon]
MNFIANRKTYENKIFCSECNERILDPLQAYRSDIQFGRPLCHHCYKNLKSHRRIHYEGPP